MKNKKAKLIFASCFFFLLGGTQTYASIFDKYISAAQHEQLFCPTYLSKYEISTIQTEFAYAQPFPVAHCKYSLPLFTELALWLSLKKSEYEAMSTNKLAAFKISIAYKNGIGTKPSIKKYIKWCIKSAKEGSYPAQKETFNIYETQKNNLTINQRNYLDKNIPAFLNRIQKHNKGEYYYFRFISSKGSGNNKHTVSYLIKSAKNGNDKSYLLLAPYDLLKKKQIFQLLENTLKKA